MLGKIAAKVEVNDGYKAMVRELANGGAAALSVTRQ